MGRSAIRKASLAAAPAGPPPQGKSRQPQDEDPYTPNEAIDPPENLEGLARLTGVGRTRRSCIAAVVLNSVGRGATIQLREGEDGSEDELIAARRRLDELSRRDHRLKRPDFLRQLGAVCWDRNEVGNGYIEVSRNRTTGQIDGLFHIPGKRLRRLRTRDGWILGPRARSSAGDDRVRFYDFGAKVQYDDEGRPLAKLASNGMRWEINEIIPLQIYTSESSDYGLPPDASLALDFAGDKKAAEANLGYFDSSGVPPSIIFVTGKEADGEDDEDVEFEVDPSIARSLGDAMLASGGRQKRVVVVPVPPGTKAEKIDLAVLSDRDIGYVGYRRDNRRATMGSWRLAPIFIADIEDTNYSTAEIEIRITRDQVFDPEQREVAGILNETIIRELDPRFQIVFDSMPIEIPEAQRSAADSAADRGLMTNGEYRDAIGLAQLPEGTPEQIAKGEASVPEGWAQQLVSPRGGKPAARPEDDQREPIGKADPADPAARLGDELAEGWAAALEDAVNEIGVDLSQLKPLSVERGEDGAITIREAELPAAA
jgi:capsid portal protein